MFLLITHFKYRNSTTVFLGIVIDDDRYCPFWDLGYADLTDLFFLFFPIFQTTNITTVKAMPMYMAYSPSCIFHHSICSILSSPLAAALLPKNIRIWYLNAFITIVTMTPLTKNSTNAIIDLMRNDFILVLRIIELLFNSDISSVLIFNSPTCQPAVKRLLDQITINRPITLN